MMKKYQNIIIFFYICLLIIILVIILMIYLYINKLTIYCLDGKSSWWYTCSSSSKNNPNDCIVLDEIYNKANNTFKDIKSDLSFITKIFIKIPHIPKVNIAISNNPVTPITIQENTNVVPYINFSCPIDNVNNNALNNIKNINFNKINPNDILKDMHITDIMNTLKSVDNTTKQIIKDAEQIATKTIQEVQQAPQVIQQVAASVVQAPVVKSVAKKVASYFGF
jgi:hypothetical protein